MQAVILAAGKSTRTYPLTVNKPKPLLKILDKTLLEQNLEALTSIVDEVIVIVGYKKEMIRAMGRKYKNITIRYVEQKSQLGTGHAIQYAKKYIKDRVLIMNGDDLYSRKDIQNCVKNDFCVLGKEVSDAPKWGILKVEKGYLKKIIEKPKNIKTGIANIGLYLVNKEIFDIKLKKSARNEYEIVDALTEFAKAHKVKVEIVQDYWLPIGYPWHYLEANEFFLSKIKSKIGGKVEKGVSIKGKVVIGKNTIVKSGSYIEGPVFIGENSVIGPNCYIRAYTTIGNNCKVGNAVEIKNSIIGDNTSIGHLTYVGDSVIGNYVNFGAGTIIANLRHDNAKIKTSVNGTLIDTGRRKLGAIIGDNVKLAINTLVYPGRKIWPDKTTLPGEIIKKDVM